jgi:hypothetical protein
MKIVICTPVYEHPKLLYTTSLAGLLLTEAPRREINYNVRQGDAHHLARNKLTRQALDAGADYLLWIDADQSFPPYTLDRLLSHGQPIVGCNIARRGEPSYPTARMANGGFLYTPPDVAPEAPPQEVDRIGLGLCLVAREVFEAIPEPWFHFDGEFGEDYYFCAKAREAGYRILVDHPLSWQVGHVGERTYTNADALADLERFKAETGLA